MEYAVHHGALPELRTDCIIAGVHERELSPAAAVLDKASNGHLAAIVRRGDLDGKSQPVLMLHDVPGLACQRVLLVGCGSADELDEVRYRKILAAAARALGNSSAADAVNCLGELPVPERTLDWRLRQAVAISAYTLYRFEAMKSEPAPARALRQISLHVDKAKEVKTAEQAVREAAAIADGVSLARNLGNMPGNICTPAWLAEQARELAGRLPAIHTTVLEKKDMQALGMNALLAVSRGSRQPPKLIVMEYRGADAGEAPVVLVGKGLTFDSGGISLKPGEGMDEMKFDMCGAASVFGTLQAVATLGLPINVVGVIPSSENLPDGQALKPGDILTSMAGQTIEVLNTDAEGRLILCDALTYSERFQPCKVVDIATLTGACIIALGHHASGLYSNHEPLARELLTAGQTSGDRAWQMPLWEEYHEDLQSNFADVANVGSRAAGSVTAACFLARFTRQQQWAHLDIAGSAWLSGKQKGATGRPVSLLSTWLLGQAHAASRQ